MRIVGFDARRAENSYAWTYEMESSKASQKIAHHAQEGEKLGETGARSLGENLIRAS